LNQLSEKFVKPPKVVIPQLPLNQPPIDILASAARHQYVKRKKAPPAKLTLNLSKANVLPYQLEESELIQQLLKRQSPRPRRDMTDAVLNSRGGLRGFS